MNANRICRLLILTLLLLSAGPAARAAEPEAEPAGANIAEAAAEAHEAEADVAGIVLGHIGDSYEWHITSWNGHHITLPLPVIVRSPRSGWHCFSSARLHGGREYEGFRIAGEGPWAGKVVERDEAGDELRPLDISLTKTTAGLLINSALVVAIILLTARWYRRRTDRRAPKGFVGMLEALITSLLDDIIRPCVGPRYRKFAPYLLTAFFFIFVNNLMGLIPLFPAGTNVTGNIAVALVLAVATFIAINLFGTKSYWKDIFWPEVPVWLKLPVPLMPLIEFVGIFTKPFALMIRLFANIMAGHSVILILTCIVFATAKLGAAVNGTMSAVSVLLCIFMNCLELLVAFLQAYVFTMLSAVFIGLAQEEHEPRAEAPAAQKAEPQPLNETTENK